MKGFRNTSKGQSGHHFPAKFGFSDSSGKTQTIRSYTRRVVKKAEGGLVDSSVIKRTVPMTQFDAEHGGTSPLRPGFKKGGKVHKGMGFKREPLIGS